MEFGTEKLTPPPCTSNTAINNPEPLISEADYQRRQAEIARCLADFRDKWSQTEPLAEVIHLRASDNNPIVPTSPHTDFHVAG